MKTNQVQLILNISKIAIIILIAIFVFRVYSTTDRTYDISVDDVTAEVFAEGLPDGCIQASALEFRDIYELDAENYEGLFYCKPEDNMDVCEIIIAKTDSDERKLELLESIKERVSEQESVFEGYAPEQYALLKNAVISDRGNYVFFMVDENADKYYSSFDESLNG